MPKNKLSNGVEAADQCGTLLLSRSEITSLADFEDYFEAVHNAFAAHGQGQALAQGLLHLDADGGEFHIKGGGLHLQHVYYAFKINAGFYRNLDRYQLPNIVGTIVLCDGKTGFPLAIMESGEITRQRTAAAAAVAAKHLARPASKTVTVCGCGIQGRAQLGAIKRLFPVTRVFAYDVDVERKREFARQMSKTLEIVVEPVTELGPALRDSDICITSTPSRHYYVTLADIRPGTFIAAMGADSPEKQELEPALLSRHKVVVDILSQCERVGELHHAIEQGLITREHVYAELGEILCGKKVGRSSDDEVTIFDSTGTALQDVAAAGVVYSKAVAQGVGKVINFLG